MKSEHYHGFELPEYFTFDKVLKHVRQKIRDIRYLIVNNKESTQVKTQHMAINITLKEYATRKRSTVNDVIQFASEKGVVIPNEPNYLLDD